MKFKDIFFVGLILWKEILVVSSASNYYDGLIKYLKEDSRLRQIVYLLDDKLDYPDPLMDSLMLAVNSHFPSLTVNYSDINSNLTKQRLKLLLRPKITALFVFQLTNNIIFDKFEEFFTDDNDFLKGPSKPKCLFVTNFSVPDENVDKILEFLVKDNVVKNGYQDFSILTNTYKWSEVTEEKLNKLFLSFEKYLYIPEFNFQEVATESQWFPKYISLADDSYVAEYTKAIRFLKILKQEMYFESETLPLFLLNSKMVLNVNAVEILSHIIDFGLRCSQIDLEMPIIVMPYYNSKYMGHINILVLKYSHIKAVIPKMSVSSNEVKVSSEFWYMSIVTICTISLIRLVAFLLKFNKSTWQTLNISQIIMGMPTNQEPRNLAERTVFGSLIITCIVFTGYFYSIILDIGFRPSPEISTLAELVNSNLTPIMDYKIRNDILDAEIDMNQTYKTLILVRQLAEKGYWNVQENIEERCLIDYIDYRNATCILNNAPHHVRNYMAQNGRTDVKILDETIVYNIDELVIESFTPNLDDFIKRILNVLEFGLSREFYRTNVNLRQTNKSELQMISKEQIFIALFYVGTIGYSLAIMAFILEVISAKIKNKFFHKPKFRFVN